MLRLFIFALLLYLLYRVLRGWISPSQNLKKTSNGGTIDEMVQDPYCKTYIPLREAKRKVIKGQDYYFCSKECCDKFENEIKTRGED